LNKIVAILALLGIFLQTFSQVVIVGEYFAQKDYIARNLCENRDKPQMHCNGKCCLKKKLAKDAKEQAPAQRNQKSEQVVNLFFADADFNIAPHFLAEVVNRFFTTNDLRTYSYQGTIFHPPGC
jgi:hypothetical protein